MIVYHYSSCAVYVLFSMRVLCAGSWMFRCYYVTTASVPVQSNIFLETLELTLTVSSELGRQLLCVTSTGHVRLPRQDEYVHGNAA